MYIAVDTLGHPLALHGTAADKQDPSQLRRTAKAMQQATGQSVGIAYVDQDYNGE